MPLWTRKRKAACIRDGGGRFKDWRGGYEKEDLKKQSNTFQGIATHIGKQFEKDHNRPARVGDIHRTRIQNGSYHKQAMYYVKTPNGWRKATHSRPAARTVSRVIRRSRVGRL